MQEHWIRYTTDKIFEKQYYFDSLEYQNKTLIIILNDPQDKALDVYVIFANSVKGFRKTNESFVYLNTLTLTDLYGSKFYAERTFFQIFHSKYLRSFTKHESLFHFAIISDDWLIDIIASAQPAITLVKRK